MRWFMRWWGSNSLVARLDGLGPGHPLVSRLEAEGWEGLGEDLRARHEVRARFVGARAPYPVEVCPACEGQGEGCPWCNGYGHIRLRDDPQLDLTGLGAMYKRLRHAGLPRSEAAVEAWRWWYGTQFSTEYVQEDNDE